MTTVSLQIPPDLIPVFTGNHWRRVARGGRGSGKTQTFAKMTAVRAMMMAAEGKSGVILCGREYMNSLEESSMEEVKQAIKETPWLDAFFDIGEKYIRTKDRRISYVFCGLRHNLDSVKSKARILIAWIDEAESVSEMAWRKLLPTVREEGSEVWVTYNPESSTSATDRRFWQEKDADTIAVHINYDRNPWFPSGLDKQRQSDMARLDPNTYRWIWEGAYLENSDKQVIKRWRVAEFDDDLWEQADRLLFGADFGFADDPSTLIRMFILGDKLYIEHEAWGLHVELDDMAEFYDSVPGSRRWPIKADSSRPETISKIKREGFNIKAAKKWSGSVEDGIAHLNGFKEIVIHPRCKHVIEEAAHYSYKVDRNGDILPVIVDDWNHCWDAIRYGLDGYIAKKGRSVFDVVE